MKNSVKNILFAKLLILCNKAIIEPKTKADIWVTLFLIAENEFLIGKR